MNGVIGDILPLAIGVAISPIPIIAAILMLFSAHAATTSSGFLVGWIAGIVVAVALFTALAGSIGGDGPQAAWVGWTKILLGVLLVVVGIRQWRGRHEQHGPPKWMSAIDRMGFGQALGLGFALSAINPKNLLMAVAAGPPSDRVRRTAFGQRDRRDRDLHRDRRVHGGGPGRRPRGRREQDA